MNNVYFACRDCRAFVDAGYRWSSSTLEEPGLVRRGERIDVGVVEQAAEYWAGATEADWLAELLPQVRQFLRTHVAHEVRYGDTDEAGIPVFESQGEYPLFDWVNEAGFALQELPRYWVERLRYRSWREVIARIAALPHPPIWWQCEAHRDAARRKFNSLVVGESFQG